MTTLKSLFSNAVSTVKGIASKIHDFVVNPSFASGLFIGGILLLA